MSKHIWRASAVVFLCGSMLASGCWGLIIYGRPGPGRNQGRVDAGVVILDLLFGGLIAITIDACAGTLRRPAGWQRSRWDDSSTQRLDNYKQLGYREETGPMRLRDEFRINVRPEDVKTQGAKRIEVVWTPESGQCQTLFAGTVSEAAGKRLDTSKLSGRGSVEVRLEGREAVAWNAERPVVAAVAAR